MRSACLSNRRNDASVNAASTEMTLKGAGDLALRKLTRAAVDKGRGSHHHSREAKTALARLCLDKSLLDRVRPLGCKTGGGRHVTTGSGPHGCIAGVDGDAIEPHGARAAQTGTAAVAHAGVAMLTEDPQQGRLGKGRNLHGCAVDLEGEVLLHEHLRPGQQSIALS